MIDNRSIVNHFICMLSFFLSIFATAIKVIAVELFLQQTC